MNICDITHSGQIALTVIALQFMEAMGGSNAVSIVALLTIIMLNIIIMFFFIFWFHILVKLHKVSCAGLNSATLPPCGHMRK